MGSPFVIEASGVIMTYGQVNVLKGIDFQVKQGEVMCVLGPNGAGKSTLIEILEGYRSRSAGQVQVLGTDPEKADATWRNRVGVVQQSWRDHVTWTVRDMLRHFTRYYDAPYTADELLSIVALQDKADLQLKKLSGGQRRRVDVALGIIGKPKLLFLDEPTTGFDPEARRDFHDLVRNMRDEHGVTIVLTTHDLAEAERLADTISVLIAGQVRHTGSLDELVNEVTQESVVRWVDGDGNRCEQVTPEPEKFVYELTMQFGGPIPGLTVIRPTLEDTYLSLVREQFLGIQGVAA